jgi:predicted nucleic acid-binding protein
MKVIDSSALIDALTHEDRGPRLRATLDDDIFAPDLLVSEVLGFVRRKQFQQRLTVAEADELVRSFFDVPIEYSHVWPYGPRMWQWRDNMTPYDATYVALAADLGATLVTTDLRLARAAEAFVPVIAV